MEARLTSSAVVLLVSFVACFRPDPQTELACAAAAECPPGQQCDLTRGLCTTPNAYTSGVTDIALGSAHACAVVDSSVQCWGSADNGRLGNGRAAGTFRSPQKIAVEAPIHHIAGGNGFSYALSFTHGTYCTGQKVICADAEGTIVNFTGDITFDTADMVSAASDLACAVRDGTAWCWGDNEFGQTGAGAMTAWEPPQPVQGLSDVTFVSAGHTHACAIAKDTAWCWGRNEARTTPGVFTGALGTGEMSKNTAVPVAVAGLDAPVSVVVAGANHSCAIRERQLFCWGWDQEGQLGSSVESELEETRAPAFAAQPVPSLINVTQVAAGASHTCALADGRLYCWGQNKYGQLGNGRFGDNEWRNPTPIRVDSLPEPITWVAAGGNNTCAIADGLLYCWGRNNEGQVGNNSQLDVIATPQHAELQ